MDTNISINSFLVYKHTNLLNNKVYIGITKNSPNRRWCNGNGYKRNLRFWSAIQKYGWNNFSHEIIREGLTEKEALELEESLIAEYDSTNRNKGYNNLISSVSNHHHFTEEDKKKISNGYKNYFNNLSEEEKENFREIHRKCSNTETAKINMSLGQRKRFENETPQEKELRREKHRVAAEKNIENIRRGVRNKLSTLTEEDWKKRGEAVKKGLNTPEAKLHMSEGHRRGLNTPEAIERKKKKREIYNRLMKEGVFSGPHSWNEFSKWYSQNKESL